jgi:hypothetical protein
MHVTSQCLCSRCAALDYKISKSQKKVLKRLHRFLSHGDTKAGDDSKSAGGSFPTLENSGNNMGRSLSRCGSVNIQMEMYSRAINCFVLSSKVCWQ